MNIKGNIKLIFVIFTIAAICIVGYAYFIEPNYIKDKFLNIDSDCLTSTSPSRSFIQISDLHFTQETNDRQISDINDKINAHNPSSVFITGDLIADKNGIEKAVKLVKMITKRYPAYIVFGNWDYWSLDFDTKEFTSLLEKAGGTVLTNKNDKIDIDGNTFYLLGVKDPYTSGENAEDIEKALSGIDYSVRSCKILLAHSPNVIKYAKDRGIDLILVGHTHGGQIFIPYISDYFIPARREAGKGYVSGLYAINNDKMYVNRGIGTSVIPLRFMSPPELTIIRIH